MYCLNNILINEPFSNDEVYILKPGNVLHIHEPLQPSGFQFHILHTIDINYCNEYSNKLIFRRLIHVLSNIDTYANE